MEHGGGGPPLLALHDVHVTYGEAVQALRGVSLTVGSGEVVAVLGANGAGKTTTARAVGGLLGLHRGRVVAGSVELDGRPVHRLGARAVVRLGVAQVLEGRRVFARLTVEENLRAARHGAGTARTAERDDVVRDLFPILTERGAMLAGNLSGGEQQMLAIAQALLRAPRLLVLDEPTLGLAPRLVDRIGETVAAINQRGIAVLLIEQSLAIAPLVADRAVVLRRGQVAWEGPGAALGTDPAVRAIYLGAPEAAGDDGHRL